MHEKAPDNLVKEIHDTELIDKALKKESWEEELLSNVQKAAQFSLPGVSQEAIDNNGGMFQKELCSHQKVQEVWGLLAYAVVTREHVFENLIHYLARHDEPSCLMTLCQKKEGDFNFLACPYSPLEVSEEETAHAMIGYYQYQAEK